MPTVAKGLGQAQPSDTNNYKIYTAEKGVSGKITSIFVCNVTNNRPRFRVFHSVKREDTQDTTTALFYDVRLSRRETLTLEFSIPFQEEDEFFVRTDTANEITFTVYGEETT